MLSALSASIVMAMSLSLIPEVDNQSTPMQQVGQASYKLGFWRIYDAALFAPDGEYDPDQPFALALTYNRSFKKDRIVDATFHEIARMTDVDQASLETLRAPLTDCFSDVVPGDRITGVRVTAEETHFFYNGEKRCALEEAGFSASFFNIWLGENSRNPKMTARLKGLSR